MKYLKRAREDEMKIQSIVKRSIIFFSVKHRVPLLGMYLWKMQKELS